jgi:hypothetical protein
MNTKTPVIYDIFTNFADGANHADETPQDDLWFLPGPIEDEPDFQAPGPRAELGETSIPADWKQAEAGLAAGLARVAGRLGSLDERLRRGPAGWRHRLALIEAADLSWFIGDRIASDRLALWIALRLSGVQDDTAALARMGWAVRRLTGGQQPEANLSEFLGRHDTENLDDTADRFADRAGGWLDLMGAGRDLHPISRACMGYHLWSLAGLDQHGDRMEAAVTAGRIAASEASELRGGAVFAPLAMGGAGGLRAGGPPAERLARWLDGMGSATLKAMRHLDDIEAWTARTEAVMTPLSGRTPSVLLAVLREWPLVSAPMAEALTGASRAAVQRNLVWMQTQGLIREVTGQGRFRMWRAAV